MNFEYDWYILKNKVVHYIKIYGYSAVIDDVYLCMFQYILYCLIYILILRLIKEMLNNEED